MYSNGRIVTASVYGGDGEPGCRDNNLEDGGYYYAELSKDPKKLDYSALGKLDFGHRLKITYNGRSVFATKADVGKGGPRKPQIDLHITLAKALNFPFDLGLADVYIEDA